MKSEQIEAEIEEAANATANEIIRLIDDQARMRFQLRLLAGALAVNGYRAEQFIVERNVSEKEYVEIRSIFEEQQKYKGKETPKDWKELGERLMAALPGRDGLTAEDIIIAFRSSAFWDVCGGFLSNVRGKFID